LTTIGDRFSTKNNFDLIRLVAAVTVLVSHSWPLCGSNFEPFAFYLGGYDTGGGWAVSVFFIISGFLVTRSVEGRDIESYLMSRVLRIIPALAFVTLVETFVIGPIFFSGSFSKYIGAGALKHLLNINVFDIATELPGVFSGLPSHLINGSLWTLPVECSFYIVLPFLAFSFFRNRFLTLFLIVFVAAGYTVMVAYGYDWANQGGLLFSSVPLFYGLKSFLFFLAGSALWIWRRSIPFSPGLAICAVLLLVAAHEGYAARPAYHIALPYLTIYLAVSAPIAGPILARVGDLSYGTYLFAFPIQQAVLATAGTQIGPIGLALAALPITLPVAFLSWKLVEQPALLLKRRLASNRPAKRSDSILQKTTAAD